MNTFSSEKQRYAELAVKVGLNLQEGQQLIIQAPLETVDLVRFVTDEAYKAGASDVTVFYQDNESVLSRLRYAKDASLVNQWLPAGIAQAFSEGAARLVILGDSPNVPDALSRARQAYSAANMAALTELGTLLKKTASNWSLLAYATPQWASSVFPDLEVDVAIDRLWREIFASVRLDKRDAVAEWDSHNQELFARASFMNERNFDALIFSGPGTELSVGLAEGHIWKGGAKQTLTGIRCNSNLPTEEIFTTPHSHKVNGFVRATKPMVYQGKIISGIQVRFEDGVAVDVSADENQSLLEELLTADASACRLGEVALVPHSSPISKSGILFKNTLFDENASCHLAFGGSYNHCMKPGTESDHLQRGANRSIIHQDWMIGSGDMDVYGVKDGVKYLIMKNGEWV